MTERQFVWSVIAAVMSLKLIKISRFWSSGPDNPVKPHFNPEIVEGNDNLFPSMILENFDSLNAPITCFLVSSRRESGIDDCRRAEDILAMMGDLSEWNSNLSKINLSSSSLDWETESTYLASGFLESSDFFCDSDSVISLFVFLIWSMIAWMLARGFLVSLQILGY